MTTVAKFARVPTSRSSRQIATNDDAAANEEEVEEQIEEHNVNREAGENAASGPLPLMSNEQSETADNAVASKEGVEEQAEESRIDKVAFEDGVSTASAKEYIKRGHTHD